MSSWKGPWMTSELSSKMNMGTKSKTKRRCQKKKKTQNKLVLNLHQPKNQTNRLPDSFRKPKGDWLKKRQQIASNPILHIFLPLKSNKAQKPSPMMPSRSTTSSRSCMMMLKRRLKLPWKQSRDTMMRNPIPTSCKASC